MVQQHCGLTLGDVGARGVLAAYDEALELVAAEGVRRGGDGCDGSDEEDDESSDERGGGPALRVFDELVRRWDAPLPMGLLRALHPAPPPPPPPQGDDALVMPADDEGEADARPRG